MNKRILTNPNTGVKKVAPKPVTKFEEFDLECGKRPQNKSLRSDTEEKFEFHAQPAPKKILEGPVVRQLQTKFYLSAQLFSLSQCIIIDTQSV